MDSQLCATFACDIYKLLRAFEKMKKKGKRKPMSRQCIERGDRMRGLYVPPTLNHSKPALEMYTWQNN
ncbi:hypothetical protein PIB30_035627 [Stylosanthes scabra]|uniref:Uncharacterized protein n=1 Tax=Stylosanthes scabra TaxID=79078 RepID=A0ABU6ZBJ3_9FABA|nr:hypothetical protein [Stylosanthes scabra]